jgi:hypothetical protein
VRGEREGGARMHKTQTTGEAISTNKYERTTNHNYNHTVRTVSVGIDGKEAGLDLLGREALFRERAHLLAR